MKLERLYQPPEIGAPGIRRARRQRRDLVLSGLFILAMAAVVAAVVLLNRPALFGSRQLRAYFPEAIGLGRGVDVVLLGEVVGHVGSVKTVFATDVDAHANCPRGLPGRSQALPCFRADLQIRRRWPVPADSGAQLVPASFMGGYQVLIEPGGAKEVLADGDPIDTLSRRPDLASQASEALARLQATIDDTIRPALVKLQSRIQDLVAAMGSAEEGAEGSASGAGEGLAEVVQNIGALSARLKEAAESDSIGNTLANVEEATANLASFSRVLKERNSEVDAAVQQYSELGAGLNEVVNTAGPEITDSLDDVQYLLQELAAALTPILANLETTSRNLAALTGDLRRNPKSLLFEKPKEPSPWLKR